MIDLNVQFMIENLSRLLVGLGIFFWTLIQVDHWDDERRERQKLLQQSKKLL